MGEWKVLARSVTGTSHETLGIPCQDSCFTRAVCHSEHAFLILVVADGAGSAIHSHIGAQIACQTLAEAIEDRLTETQSLESMNRELALHWCERVRDRLKVCADEIGTQSRQLACTLLAAIVSQDQAVFLQIGDGAIVVLEGGEYKHVFWPQHGEYVNTTTFVTDDDVPTILDFERRDARLDELAVLSDGLEMVALNYGDAAVHQEFFSPMFLTLRTTVSTVELVDPFDHFLRSDRINERTDDDKTLILATRLLTPATVSGYHS